MIIKSSEHTQGTVDVIFAPLGADEVNGGVTIGQGVPMTIGYPFTFISEAPVAVFVEDQDRFYCVGFAAKDRPLKFKGFRKSIIKYPFDGKQLRSDRTDPVLGSRCPLVGLPFSDNDLLSNELNKFHG